MPNQRAAEIQTCPRRECPLCGNNGATIHEGLTDDLFDAPGEWDLRKCSNDECSLVWLDPAPADSDIGKIYENYHTHGADEISSSLPHRLYRAVRDGHLRNVMGYRQGVGPAWYGWLSPIARLHPFGRAHIRESAMFLEAPAGKQRLLDVGCGSGFVLARMRDLGWEVEGTEIDPVAVEVSRARGVNVRQGDLAQQSYADNSFDAVHVSHVIEHVSDPVGLVSESRRILKPGGTLVIRTPNIDSWGHRRFKSHWRGLEPPRHLHLFNCRSLSNIMSRAGFNVERASIKTRATGIIAMSQAIEDGPLHPNDSGLLRNLRVAIKNLLSVSRERVLLLSAPDVGEELVAIAKK